MKKKDKARLAWCRQRPCIFEGGDCHGDIEAHHPTGAGLALKAPDDQTIPLCQQHHRDRHDHTGPFKNMTKAQRKEWEADMVTTYQALYAADHPEEF